MNSIDDFQEEEPKTKTQRPKFLISEFLGLGVLITAVIFKLLHWPGATFFLLIGMVTLIVTYLIWSFKKPVFNLPIGVIGERISYIAIALMLCFALFVFMFYPGQKILQYSAAITSLLGVILVLIHLKDYRIWKSPALLKLSFWFIVCLGMFNSILRSDLVFRAIGSEADPIKEFSMYADGYCYLSYKNGNYVNGRCDQENESTIYAKLGESQELAAIVVNKGHVSFVLSDVKYNMRVIFQE